MSRIEEKKDKFKSLFHKKEEIISISPGRVNLIGEHTDYNGGWVLPAAIDKYATVLIDKNKSLSIRVFAFDIDQHFEYHQDSINQHKGWESYVVGVIEEIRKIKKIETGFDILISGDVPFGAGLSSSASIECALAYSINELLNLNISKERLATICQLAEHNFVGVKCGIMDQYTSMMGKAKHALYLDCKTTKHEYVPINLGEFVILLCNTNVSHSLASSEYNTRREQCEEGVRILQEKYSNIKFLRDIDESKLLEIENNIPDIIYQRCLYVVQENDRVKQAALALKKNDIDELGRLMYLSHHGLSKMYEVSCPELDFLVELTKDKDYILGSRMMGGGFGGCTINIIHKNKVDEFIQEVSPKYSKKFQKEMTPYMANIGDGARLIQYL